MTRGPVFVEGEVVGRPTRQASDVAAKVSAVASSGPASEFDVFEYLNDENHDLLRDPVLQRMTVVRYDGDVNENGFFHGKGTLVSTFGYTYTGDLDRGLMHGEGSIVWSNGTSYTGTFHNNVPNGSGAYQWGNDDTYRGQVKDAIRHGKGVFVYSALAATYDGDWSEGMRHGVGFLKYSETSSYRGQWQNDKREGKGLMIYETGDRYEGEWKDDKRHGYGVMVWTVNENVVEVYKGHWTEGLQHGEGFSMYIRLPASIQPKTFPPPTAPGALGDIVPPKDAAINTYLGHHKRGVRHGFGAFTYDDGSKYEGMWREHCKHGEGKSTSSFGVVTVDQFENGTIVRSVTEGGAAGEVEEKSLDALSVETAGVPLYIRDVLGSSENNVHEATVSVQSILLRHNGLLRRVFQAYCNISDAVAVVTTPASWRRDRTHGSMTLIQFHRFLSDARLLNGSLTVAEVDRMLTNMEDRNTPTTSSSSERHTPPPPVKPTPKNNHATAAKAQTSFLSHKLPTPWSAYRKSLYVWEGELTFRDFVEALVRIAAFVYEDAVFGTLSFRVLIVIEEHLAPLLLATPPKHPLCPTTRANKESVVPHLDLMRTLFIHFSQASSLGFEHDGARKPLDGGEVNTTIRVRQCLLMLKEAGCFQTDRLSVPIAMHKLFPFDKHPTFTAAVHKKRMLPPVPSVPQPAPPRSNSSDATSEAPTTVSVTLPSGAPPGLSNAVFRGRWLLQERSKGYHQHNIHNTLQPELELTFVEFVEAMLGAALLLETANVPTDRVNAFIKTYLKPLRDLHC